jgi:hypothetical protein
MWGTPNASLETVARDEIGAEICPDVCGSGRYATQ